MSTSEISLQITGEVRKILESRGIRDEDLKQVIQSAEELGEKLYRDGENRFLAKKKIGEPTFYVEYSTGEGNDYVIHTAYAHKSSLEE